jgi:hypothetical protein
MHEDMEQGTGQDQKPKKGSERMGAMLGGQQVADNDEKRDKDDTRARAEKAAAWSIVIRHAFLLDPRTAAAAVPAMTIIAAMPAYLTPIKDDMGFCSDIQDAGDAEW